MKKLSSILVNRIMSTAIIIFLITSIMIPGVSLAEAPVTEYMPLASHNVIRINNDTDFDGAHGVNSGSGTAGDPYIIDNWEIDGSTNGSCMYIGNTTKHFILRNCTLSDASGFSVTQYFYDTGIYLHNVTNSTVYNNTLDGNNWGVYTDDAHTDIDDNNFTNQTAKDIFIDSGSIVNVTDNYIDSDGSEDGILLSSDNSTLMRNTVISSGGASYSIRLSSGANDCNVSHNNLSATVSTTNGINVSGNTNTLFMNDVNGSASKYFTVGILITSGGTDNMIYGNNVSYCSSYGIETSATVGANTTVTSNDIFQITSAGIHYDFPSYDPGVCSYNDISFCTNRGIFASASVTISWCNITETPNAIYGWFASSYNVDNCTIDANSTTGTSIYLDGGSATVDNCTVINGGDGIEFFGVTTVKNCNISGNSGRGIVSGLSNIIIDSNTLEGNGNYALSFAGTNYLITRNNIRYNGMTSFQQAQVNFGVTNSVMSYNNITGNGTGTDGIYMIGLGDTFYGNNISGHTGGGVGIVSHVSSTGNTFYSNNFINNSIHAIENGTNVWDNGHKVGGNYWDNYTGSDNFHGEYQDKPGGDNIGDTPYTQLPTLQDDYPLMSPVETNITPTADAGYDQIGYGGLRRLFGNDSSDAIGLITNYTWWFVFNSTPHNFYTEQADFTFDIVGEYNITLNVTDADTNTDSDYSIMNITSVPFFYDDGIRSDWNTSLTPNNVVLDTTSGRKTVQKLNVSQVTTFRDATMFNSTINMSHDTFVINWSQNISLLDDDNVNITLDSNGKLSAIEIYKDTVNINGQNFTGIDPKEGDWANWIVVLTNNGTTAHVSVNDVVIGNQSTPYTGIADELLFGLVENGANSSSTMDIDWIVVYNYSSPIANAGVDQSGNEGIYNFDGTLSIGAIVNYTWTFTYNATPITLYTVSPSFNFTRAGNHQVVLNVTDALGVYDTDDMWINITNQLPVADAGTNQAYGRGNHSLNGTLTADPDGYITNYTWNFTDGGVVFLYDVQPYYNFTNAGVFVIMLDVTDDESGHGFDNVTITINNALPIADAGIDQTGKRTKTFDGSSSTDPDGTITNYTWNFTYNAVLTEVYGVSPSFDFNITDNYLVNLTVTDNDSDTDVDTMWMNITVSPPTADAGVDQFGEKGIYNFDASGSSDSDGMIINYTWNFTHNSVPVTLYGLNPSYNFVNNETSVVTLNVTDDDWRYGTDNMLVTINFTNPVANAGADQGTDKGIYSLDASASSDSDGVIVNYTWWFVYNSLPTNLYGINPSFDFQLEDVYEILLNVTDDDTLTGSDTTNVTIVFILPVANAGADFEELRGNHSLSGAGSTDADGTIVNYTWNFTDAGAVVLYGINPTYDFQNVGVFVITLNVTDDSGLYDEDTVSVSIVLAYPVSVVGEYGHFGRVLLGDNITLNGNGSTDADGTIVNYTWEITQGNQSIATVYGITVVYLFNASGTYNITLNVTDDDGLYNTSSTSVIVSSEIGFLLITLIAIAPVIIILLLIVFIKRRLDEMKRKNQV